jgi:hypothetical protein
MQKNTQRYEPVALPFMRNYNQLYYQNVARDYNVLQGVTHPSDLTNQIIRDINLRYVTIQNSSPSQFIGIGIAEYFYMNPKPPIKFWLAPGEIRHLGINTFGEPMQYIHMFDSKTKLHVGEPYPFRTNANDFVLRDGINKWFVQGFQRPSYAASK